MIYIYNIYIYNIYIYIIILLLFIYIYTVWFKQRGSSTFPAAASARFSPPESGSPGAQVGHSFKLSTERRSSFSHWLVR